jgi:hypothetical protein
MIAVPVVEAKIRSWTRRQRTNFVNRLWLWLSNAAQRPEISARVRGEFEACLEQEPV